MEFRHLQAAVALAEELHFGRAALRLHVVQSAVSTNIKDLEAELGVQLFERTKRSVALTPAGVEFVVRARGLLDGASEIPVHTRRVAKGEAGTLRLRFVLSSALTDVPRCIAEFQRRYPNVSLMVQPGSSRVLFEELETGMCDVAFVATAHSKGGLAFAHRVVAESAMVALLPVGHALAKRKFVRLEELSSDPLVFPAQRDEPEIHRAFWRHCIQAGFDPTLALEVGHTDALLSFVAAGLGVSCVPGFVQKLKFPGVKAVPLRPRIMAGIMAVWDEERISATGRNFLDLIPVLPAKEPSRN